MARRKRNQKPNTSPVEKQAPSKAEDSSHGAEDQMAAGVTGTIAEEPTTPKHMSKSATRTKSENTDPQLSDRVTQTLENVERWLAETTSSSEATQPDLSQWQQAVERSLDKSLQKSGRQMKAHLDSIAKSLEARIKEQLAQLGDRTGVASTPSFDEPLNESEATPVTSSTESDWERRKREMFAESGEDYEGATAFDTPADRAAKAAAEKAEQDELASLTESLHVSIESLDEVEAEDIEDLRQQLSEKLRETEVELSINRAKLDQRRANLEKRETELERRERSLASKYSDVDGKPQRKGILDRLTRHLGARKERDSL